METRQSIDKCGTVHVIRIFYFNSTLSIEWGIKFHM